jgi:hypothetical protein
VPVGIFSILFLDRDSGAEDLVNFLEAAKKVLFNHERADNIDLANYTMKYTNISIYNDLAINNKFHRIISDLNLTYL